MDFSSRLLKEKWPSYVNRITTLFQMVTFPQILNFPFCMDFTICNLHEI